MSSKNVQSFCNETSCFARGSQHFMTFFSWKCLKVGLHSSAHVFKMKILLLASYPCYRFKKPTQM